MITSTLDALLIGTPQSFHPERGMSSMARRAVHGPVMLSQLGFAGDAVADPRSHGGPDKAVHFYPIDHYSAWRADIGEHPHLAAPGGFGENLSARGLTEDRLRIGDRFRIGAALVEVSQGRQPCWKLDHHFARAAMAADVIRTGRSGCYFRVIEAGAIAAGDPIVQVAAGPAEWTVARVFRLLIGGGHKDAGSKDLLTALAALPELAQDWRERAAKLLASAG